MNTPTSVHNKHDSQVFSFSHFSSFYYSQMIDVEVDRPDVKQLWVSPNREEV